MKKITLSLLALSFIMTASAQMEAFFPQFGDDAKWSVNEKFELVFAGPVVAPVPTGAIATTFEGLVSDGNGFNDFTGLKMEFDAYIFNQPTNTTLVVAWNGKWSATEGLGVNLDYNQWLCQAAKNYDYANVKWMVPNPPTEYQAAVKYDTYNHFIIDIDATGKITTTLNGYLCSVPYEAGTAILKPTALSQFTVVFVNNVSGWKMKNLVVKKGSVTNSYFSNPDAAVKTNKQANFDVYPVPSKGNFTITSESIGQKYEVTNILGQLIKSGIISGNKHVLDLSSEQDGSYLLSVEGKNGKSVRQIVKN
ncbi:MAG: T9SS type A sorting domain-containing protein [Paludibacter sp.]